MATWVGVGPTDLDVIGTLTIAGDRYHPTIELSCGRFPRRLLGPVRVALAARAIYLAASEENDER